MRKVVLATLFLLASLSVNAQDVFGKDTKAFMLMPAESISNGIVTNPSISESGRWVIYQRRTAINPEDLRPNPKKSAGDWYSYDRKSKQSKKLNVSPLTEMVSALGDDQYGVYMTSDEIDGNVGFVDLKTGVRTPIPTDLGQLMYTGEFTFAPFLMFQGSDNTYTLIFPNGKQNQIKLSKDYQMHFPVASDQNCIYFLARTQGLDRGKSVQLALNRQSGMVNMKNLTSEENNKLFENLRPNSFFMVRAQGDMSHISIYEQKSTPNQTLIPNSAKVGPQNGWVVVSNQNDFVIYQDAGALLLREIKLVDALTALKGIEDDLKKELLNRAKQMGTAFAIFAADNDDILPGAEGWEAKIRPYIKNDEVMKGFNYTFRGGNSNVENPSKTEMGFLVGPGGRAVVYMDGSARWLPNP